MLDDLQCLALRSMNFCEEVLEMNFDVLETPAKEVKGMMEINIFKDNYFLSFP